MTFKDRPGDKISLDNSNVLLRGSKVRFTQYAVGVVVYQGHDTKVMQNNKDKVRTKFTDLENNVNRSVIYTFLIELALIFVMAWLFIIYEESDEMTSQKFLEKSVDMEESPLEWKKGEKLVILMGIWIQLTYNIIAPSLIITYEVTKRIHGKFMEADMLMMDEDRGQGLIVNACNVNDDLGQIGYVFTDKTGTLTRNEMVFRNFTTRDSVYEASPDSTNEVRGV